MRNVTFLIAAQVHQPRRATFSNHSIKGWGPARLHGAQQLQTKLRHREILFKIAHSDPIVRHRTGRRILKWLPSDWLLGRFSLRSHLTSIARACSARHNYHMRRTVLGNRASTHWRFLPSARNRAYGLSRTWPCESTPRGIWGRGLRRRRGLPSAPIGRRGSDEMPHVRERQHPTALRAGGPRENESRSPNRCPAPLTYVGSLSNPRNRDVAEACTKRRSAHLLISGFSCKTRFNKERWTSMWPL
jgi:hypothetical protein